MVSTSVVVPPTKMRDSDRTSMIATFAVASELLRRNYLVGLVGWSTRQVDLICSVLNGSAFKVQVKGSKVEASTTKKGFHKKHFVPVQKEFLEATPQQDLFLVVVSVPPADEAALRFFVLRHADAIKEWNGMSDTKADGTSYDPAGFYWGLYLKENIEPYEGKWEKLPK